MTLTKRTTLLLFAAFAACNGTASTEDSVGQVSAGFSVGAVYNFGTLAHPGACMDASGGGTAERHADPGVVVQRQRRAGVRAAERGRRRVHARQHARQQVRRRRSRAAPPTAPRSSSTTATERRRRRSSCSRRRTASSPSSTPTAASVSTSPPPIRPTAPSVQLYDCNGTNAQLWNPAVISGGGGGGGGLTGGGGGTTGGGGGTTGGGGGMAVHVTNSCPVDVWVHGVGSEGALQPDNATCRPAPRATTTPRRRGRPRASTPICKRPTAPATRRDRTTRSR